MLPFFAAFAQAHETPSHVEALRAEIDWQAVEQETSDWLSAYIQIDTVAPPGNEMDGVRFLTQILRREGIDDLTVVEHGDNRGSLIARLPGTGAEPPLCLLSHIDVVPSERDKWTFDPLAGTVSDGFVYGRGALDMKGMGIVQLETLVLLARNAVPLARDVVLLAVADEEVAGLGMRTLVDEHWESIGCSHLINEGGLGLENALFEGQTLHAISVAEKGVLWARLVAEGRAGHGSTIEEGEAPTRLLEGMERLDRKFHPKARIDPAMYELLKRVGVHKGGLTGTLLRSKLGVNLFVKPKLMSDSTSRAVITDTLHLTGMSGASSVNVVPSTVWAQYDSRLLRGTAPDAQIVKLERLIRPIDGLHWEIIDQREANGSPWEDPFFERIAHYAVEDRPEAVAGPVISPGFTDSIFARPKGVRAYGYVPFVIDQDEALTMHGHDERISVENLREGTRRMFSIVMDFAAITP